ncbi:hypothetical protein FNV43_RR08502 [Rhamnella rubrinervis]|uniref:Uncharacterized protein n=1 Tax=Rhamnella rubrinervis TaxID=2594499 RepID=A0A8K0H907_9ROSA|nr:hypothetical protein FNV43_RR08502 [Rhamnella rubrinervis]
MSSRTQSRHWRATSRVRRGQEPSRSENRHTSSTAPRGAHECKCITRSRVDAVVNELSEDAGGRGHSKESGSKHQAVKPNLEETKLTMATMYLHGEVVVEDQANRIADSRSRLSAGQAGRSDYAFETLRGTKSILTQAG